MDTAIELAARDGYHAVRLRDVAAKAQVALGTVYKRFGSKEEILVAALTREGERLLARFSELANSPSQAPDPHGRVMAFFELATENFVRRPKLARALLRALAGERMAAHVASLHALCIGILVATLEGRAPHEPSSWGGDADVEARETAAILLEVWFAALVGWAAGAHDPSGVVSRVDRAARRLIPA